MSEKLDIDRLAFRHDLFGRLLYIDTAQSPSLLLASLPLALSILTYFNPTVHYVDIFHVLNHKETCLKLIQNIPPQFAATADWWRSFWRLQQAERYAIQNFANDRFQRFNNVLTMDIIMEFTSNDSGK